MWRGQDFGTVMAEGARAAALRDAELRRLVRRRTPVPRTPTRILFVCTANVARSPMAAEILPEVSAASGDFQARSAGTAPGATRRLTTRDLACADVVAVMETQHLEVIQRQWPRHAAKVRVLVVPDDYDPGEPELRELLAARIRRLLDEVRG